MNKIIYPVRINRYLLLKGFASRRKADEFIKSGHVKINGRLAILGDKVHEKDIVEVSKTVERSIEKRMYVAFNKPIGVVSHDPEPGQKSIDEFIKSDTLLYPIGRLDKASHGLMILSNDGTIVDKLLNPKKEHDKEYIVRVDKPLKSNFERLMSGGLNLGSFRTKKCIVEKLGESRFKIILTEGKKHQIRRMCDKLGYAVRDLKRVRIMNIRLGKLKAGDWRKIEGLELKTFLQSLETETKN